MDFSNISFKYKIYILLAAPLLGFIWLGIASISNSVATHQEMKSLSNLTHLSAVYSELVHELQKERGMTAGYLGSKGTAFKEKLAQQRLDSDQKAANRIRYWQNNEIENNSIKSLNSAINGHLNQLGSIRSRVDDLSISTKDAIGFYTKANAEMLKISTLISEISSDSQITKDTIAYYNFIQGKERAGIERAVLSNTFALGNFAPGMFTKFITLVSEQNTYFFSFNAFASEENSAYYRNQINAPAVKEVETLRATAQSKASEGDFGVESVYWFEQATKRIGVLKSVENQLTKNLLALADNTKSAAFYSLLLSGISTLGLILLALSITVYITRELQAQVSDLTGVMAKVRNNDDLTVRAQYTNESELGQVSTALNLTLEKFSGAINEISTSSSTLAAAAEETSQTCRHNLSSLVEQQEEIALIATAIEELSVTVKEVASNTQLAADSAKEADEKAVNGRGVVQQSYHSIESLAEEIANLAKRISNLHESSNNITSVVDVIKSVAEQTNLLALNAAIEAARAGEQGRGFAVVADEVRTLAQRTQDSTSEIESFITSLQNDANAAFNVIEKSQKMATDAVQNSKNVEQMLSDITNSVSNIFSMTEQVATAVEEQSMVTQDVAKNVVNVEQKSVESTAGSTQITSTAEEQANLAISLQDVAVTFKT